MRTHDKDDKPLVFDPEALDKALAGLTASAQTARDCLGIDELDLTRIHLGEAAHWLSEALGQILLLKHK